MSCSKDVPNKDEQSGMKGHKFRIKEAQEALKWQQEQMKEMHDHSEDRMKFQQEQMKEMHDNSDDRMKAHQVQMKEIQDSTED